MYSMFKYKCYMIIFIILIFNSNLMSQKAFKKHVLSYPALVKVGNKSVGSGCFVQDSLNNSYFLTAKHVLFDGNRLKYNIITVMEL